MAKARRKQAEPGGQKKAERKQARAAGQTKPERKKARAALKAAAAAPGKDAPREEWIEWRLERIEEALASESARSEELLQTVDELLGAESHSETATVTPGRPAGDGE